MNIEASPRTTANPHANIRVLHGVQKLLTYGIPHYILVIRFPAGERLQETGNLLNLDLIQSGQVLQAGRTVGHRWWSWHPLNCF